jgi:hypothetical protein
MAESASSRVAAGANKTARFLLYDRATGEVVAVHEISAALGGRLPDPDRIERLVLGEAALSLDHPEAELAMLRFRGAIENAGTLKVNLRTKRVVRTPAAKPNWASRRP